MLLHPALAARLSPVYASYALPAMRRRINARRTRGAVSASRPTLPVESLPRASGARATDPVRVTLNIAVPSAMTTLLACPACALHIVNVHGASRVRATVHSSAAPCDCCGVNLAPDGASLSDRTPDAFTARAYERCRIAACDYAYTIRDDAPASLADAFAAVRRALAAAR